MEVLGWSLVAISWLGLAVVAVCLGTDNEKLKAENKRLKRVIHYDHLSYQRLAAQKKVNG